MKDICQAIIPLTGDSPDLLSASFAIPRVMMPVFTRDGRCIPFVQMLVEECVQAGIDRILLVTTPDNDSAVRLHFDTKTPKAVSQKARADKTLSGELKNLVKLCHHIEIIEQIVVIEPVHELVVGLGVRHSQVDRPRLAARIW